MSDDPDIRFDYEGEIVHIQTHTSHVFLVGDDVYKVKKPVRFSFLDYSTVEKRKTCCEKELWLNRRFSPEVYREVVPLTKGQDGRLRIGGKGAIEDWAVLMNRLPQDRMLSELLDRRAVPLDQIYALVDKLALFYMGADRSREIDRFGMLDQVSANVEENFENTKDFPEKLFPSVLRHLLVSAHQRFVEEHGDLFEERIRTGHVLDGHGDLKPENIFLPDSGPVITDCIEFNDRFRYGDSLADVSYLTMAFRKSGRDDLREEFLSRYRRKSGDDFPQELFEYYETYRAVVKGKIEGFRSMQDEVPGKERSDARKNSLFHFQVAREIVLDDKPILLLLCGVTGAGKSSLVRPLELAFDAVTISSDLTRKSLAGIPRDRSAEAPYGEGIYSEDMTARTYSHMQQAAYSALSGGRCVIVDATQLTRSIRREMLSGVWKGMAITVVVGVSASQEALSAHHRRRLERPGPSDGRSDLAERHQDLYEAPQPDEADVVIHLDNSGSLEETRARLAKNLGEALAAL